MAAYIDQTFRKYGEDFFGKSIMETITDSQVEKARCWAMKGVRDLTIKYGRQPNGTAKELFCNYIFEYFI